MSKEIDKAIESAKQLDMVGMRFIDMQDLFNYITNEIGLNHLQNNASIGEIDEDGLSFDYEFLYGIGEEYGYINICYLKIPRGNKTIYVTEVMVAYE